MKRSDKALDQDQLESLALRYVSRYATTRHKLATYLNRKIREKGWSGERPANIDPLVEKYTELGYIDDALFAQNRASALLQKGFGKRRVHQALHQAGIEETDRTDALHLSDDQSWVAADRFAQRKRIGPYAPEQYERDKRQKLLQAFLRAGHSFEIASRFVFAEPGDELNPLD